MVPTTSTISRPLELHCLPLSDTPPYPFAQFRLKAIPSPSWRRFQKLGTVALELEFILASQTLTILDRQDMENSSAYKFIFIFFPKFSCKDTAGGVLF